MKLGQHKHLAVEDEMDPDVTGKIIPRAGRNKKIIFLVLERMVTIAKTAERIRK